MKNCLLFSGNANRRLSEKIAENLGKKLGKMNIYRFRDGEICINIEENVRGKDVFLIQPTCYPVNENLMELLIAIDAFRRASPRRLTAVLPYYGYARQDRKDKPRVPITAKLVANLFVSAGTDRILTMDLHAPQIQGFFDIPVDHLLAAPVIVKYLKEKNINNPVIVSPDAGGVKIARACANRLSASLAIVDKRRLGPDLVETIQVIGDVKNREVIIVDDLISTGSTMKEAAEKLMEQGASAVYGACTHAVFSEETVRNLKADIFKEIILTDTIPAEKLPPHFTQLSVSGLFAEAIKRIHSETSVSSLFF